MCACMQHSSLLPKDVCKLRNDGIVPRDFHYPARRLKYQLTSALGNKNSLLYVMESKPTKAMSIAKVKL
jgi:hypothetical protein